MGLLVVNALYEYPFRDADQELKLAVWNKGRVIASYDPNIWRWDACDKPMLYAEHGNTDSEYGWEIDHIYPRSKGGESTIDNLQPLNWQTNRRKSDTYPYCCE
jgi:5-methylcytosine-specific restriction endonuclease McrA